MTEPVTWVKPACQGPAKQIAFTNPPLKHNKQLQNITNVNQLSSKSFNATPFLGYNVVKLMHLEDGLSSYQQDARANKDQF